MFFLLSILMTIVHCPLLLIPVYKRKYFWFIPKLWHQAMCWCMNIKIQIHGLKQPNSFFMNSPTIFVSNHIGVGDIEILGGSLPINFVSKAEVKHWPIFGLLAMFQRTLFIEREKSQAALQRDMLEKRLKAGGAPLLFFPEGTTSNGAEVLPFKSPLFEVTKNFEASMGEPVRIIPLTLFYSHFDGELLDSQEKRDRIAYYGDLPLPPHLKALMSGKGITVHLHIHPPLSSQGKNRKQLAQETELAIRTSFRKLQARFKTLPQEEAEEEIAKAS